MNELTITIEEGWRQLILMAIAHLSNERPGWDNVLKDIAELLNGEGMYQDFKECNFDIMEALRAI